MRQVLVLSVGMLFGVSAMAAQNGSVSLETISPKVKVSDSTKQSMDNAGKKLQGMSKNFDSQSTNRVKKPCANSKAIKYNKGHPICDY